MRPTQENNRFGSLPNLLRLGLHYYEVTDDMLPPSFLKAYKQISLSAKMGGHGLREWGRHIDQAFVGQWCLTVHLAVGP